MSYYEEDYFEVDENFSFNTGINKILDQEVEKRLAGKIENYNHVIEREKKQFTELVNLQNKVRLLERELLDAEKTYVKQGSDEAKRKMFGGYKLGDKVWFARKRYEYEPCKTCEGKGRVTALFNGTEIKAECPSKCYSGRVSKYEFDVLEGTIIEAQFHVWAEERQTEYKFYVRHKYTGNNDTTEFKNTESFFKTKEECEASLKTE